MYTLILGNHVIPYMESGLLKKLYTRHLSLHFIDNHKMYKICFYFYSRAQLPYVCTQGTLQHRILLNLI